MWKYLCPLCFSLGFPAVFRWVEKSFSYLIPPGLVSWFFVLPPQLDLALHLILTGWTLILTCLICCVWVICSKQYVLLSVLLCLLASGLVVFFLFPHSVLVNDDGIKVVKVTFNKRDSLVILAITVRLGTSLPVLCTCQSWTQCTYACFLPPMQATLKIRNSNFYPVSVTSLSSQVQYMNTVVGTYMTTNVSLILPRSEQQVYCSFRVSAAQEEGGCSGNAAAGCLSCAFLLSPGDTS